MTIDPQNTMQSDKSISFLDQTGIGVGGWSCVFQVCVTRLLPGHHNRDQAESLNSIGNIISLPLPYPQIQPGVDIIYWRKGSIKISQYHILGSITISIDRAEILSRSSSGILFLLASPMTALAKQIDNKCIMNNNKNVFVRCSDVELQLKQSWNIMLSAPIEPLRKHISSLQCIVLSVFFLNLETNIYSRNWGAIMPIYISP